MNSLYTNKPSFWFIDRKHLFGQLASCNSHWSLLIILGGSGMRSGQVVTGSAYSRCCTPKQMLFVVLLNILGIRMWNCGFWVVAPLGLPQLEHGAPCSAIANIEQSKFSCSILLYRPGNIKKGCRTLLVLIVLWDLLRKNSCYLCKAFGSDPFHHFCSFRAEKAKIPACLLNCLS